MLVFPMLVKKLKLTYNSLESVLIATFGAFVSVEIELYSTSMNSY